MFIGDQLEECKDYSGLFYVMPFQKGVLVNWDVEKQIWDYIFGKEVMKVERRHSMLGDLEHPHCIYGMEVFFTNVSSQNGVDCGSFNFAELNNIAHVK